MDLAPASDQDPKGVDDAKRPAVGPPSTRRHDCAGYGQSFRVKADRSRADA
jgi:hypothetical protein